MASSLFSSSCWNDQWLISQWSSQSTLTPLVSSSAICMAVNTIFVTTSYIYTPTLVSLLNSKHVHPTAYLTSPPIWHCQLPRPKLNFSFPATLPCAPISTDVSFIPLFVPVKNLGIIHHSSCSLTYTSNVSSSPVGTIFTHIQNLTTSHCVCYYPLCWRIYLPFPKLLQWPPNWLCIAVIALYNLLSKVVLWKWSADHVKLVGFTQSKSKILVLVERHCLHWFFHFICPTHWGFSNFLISLCPQLAILWTCQVNYYLRTFALAVLFVWSSISQRSQGSLSHLHHFWLLCVILAFMCHLLHETYPDHTL